MSNRVGKLLFVFSISILTAVHPCWAQVGTLAKKGVEEILEAIAKRSGQEGVKEVMDKFGREGVEELLQKATQEGGEQAAKSVIKIAGEYGIQGINVLRRSPVVFARALDEIPPDLVRPALGAVEREPELLTRVVTKFGSRGVQAELKHPGVGGQLVDTLGADGLKLADGLATKDVKGLLPYASDIAQLPPAERGKVLEKILALPGKVVECLNKNPKVLYTAAGVATVLGLGNEAQAAADHAIDHLASPENSGALERTVKDVAESVSRALLYPIAMFVGLALFVVASYHLVLKNLLLRRRGKTRPEA